MDLWGWNPPWQIARTLLSPEATSIGPIIRALADDANAGDPTALSEAEAKALGRRIRERLLPRLLEREVKPYLEAALLPPYPLVSEFWEDATQ